MAKITNIEKKMGEIEKIHLDILKFQRTVLRELVMLREKIGTQPEIGEALFHLKLPCKTPEELKKLEHQCKEDNEYEKELVKVFNFILFG